MSRSDALLHSLATWPDLWRHPSLFAIVNGAAEAPPTPAQLLGAMLQAEPVEASEAWALIVENGDLAAIQAAYDALSPAVPAKALDVARRQFERRADRVSARAQPLPPHDRNVIWRAVKSARDSVVSNPVAAELALREADAQATVGVAKALDGLRLAFGDDGDGEQNPRALRLQSALAASDLRLAQILAGQFNAANAPTEGPIPRDPWIDRHATVDLLRWSRDPALAPAGRLPQMALADHELVLLARLEALLVGSDAGEEVSQDEAESLLRLTIWSLHGAAVPTSGLRPAAEVSTDVWTFDLNGPEAARLFPHGIDDEGVAVMIPRRPTLHFPAAPHGRRCVTFDIFERWQSVGRPDAVRMTPRMLVCALWADEREGARADAFVRLQSSAIGVRPLILNILGRDEVRCGRLIGADPKTVPALSAADIIPPLAQALDLYVDDGDLAALVDASGDRLSLLLEILQVLAAGLEGASPIDRRFNALDALLRADVADQVEALVEADLRHLLGDQWNDTLLILGEVAPLLESGALEGRSSLTTTDLADRLLAARAVSSAEEARTEIERLLALGLLQSAGASSPDGILRIRATLPLPGRILQRVEA